MKSDNSLHLISVSVLKCVSSHSGFGCITGWPPTEMVVGLIISALTLVGVPVTIIAIIKMDKEVYKYRYPTNN